MSRTATKIYFEYDDGFAEIARGEHAADVMRHLGAAQSILHVHGGAYAGKKMEECGPLIQEWQKIETAPINVAVLVYVTGASQPYHVAERDSPDGGWKCVGYRLQPTHWMPLPRGPHEKD